jgi:pyruvate dehydrogenase (quinone)
VAKALLGKDVMSDELPYVTGSIGLLGTKPSYDLMMECDTFLMLGSGFPYSEFLPKEGQARGDQIDVEPRNLSLRYPMEVALAGDSAETLAALLPMLDDLRGESWRGQIEQWKRDDVALAERQANASADPINPLRVIRELDHRLPDAAILTADSGTSAYWLGRDITLRRGMMASVSGGLATMGCGVPYALAAKLAYPTRPVIALVGDGAMQMNGISALIDVAKQWRRSAARGNAWGDPRFVVLVLNNHDLSYVTWEQRVMEGDPRYAATQTIPDFRYADYARLLGLDGIRVERPDEVAGAWERALASDRPFVIDAVVDRTVPTLPPQLKPEQEDKLTRALTNGDADAEAVLDQLQLQEVTQR